MKRKITQRKSFKERQKEQRWFYYKHYGIILFYFVILGIFIYVNI